MFTAAVVVGAATVGAAAVGAGATGIGVYRHKKKLKADEKRHKDTLSFMSEQWQEQRYNSNTDPHYYPHAKSPIDKDKGIILNGIRTFAMGWDEETALHSPDDVQFFLTTYNSQGAPLHTVTQHCNTQSPVPGITHSGFRPRPEVGRY
jgi:hypothetical protein